MSDEDVAIMDKIRTHAGCASNGKSFGHVVQAKVARGEYRLQCLSANALGTLRPIEVYRAKRARNTILKPWQASTDDDS